MIQNEAKLFGVATITISSQRLKQLQGKTEQKLITFKHNGKDTGQLSLKIKAVFNKQQKETKGRLMGQSLNGFNHRNKILFNEAQCRDQIKVQRSIKILQAQSEQLYKQFQKAKSQQLTLQTIYNGLREDEKALQQNIDKFEKQNQSIQKRINSKESLQDLKLQIELLQSTEEGLALLVEKIEYFQARILNEQEQLQIISDKYETYEQKINLNLKKANLYSQKLRGKQLQQFEIHNNQQILANYDQTQYEFRCNEQAIKSLSAMCQSSQLTTDQAALLLSQVSYNIKLENCTKGNDVILQQIESYMESQQKQQEIISEPEKLIYQIKLNALEEEIERVKEKIQVKKRDKKNFAKSIVSRI